MSDRPTLTELKMEENRQMELLPELENVEALASNLEWPSPSGKILSKDEELCLEIAEMVLSGHSDRAIAKHLRVNRRSIKPVMRILQERGKLAPLKERLLDAMGKVAMLSVQRAHEMLEDDLLPAQSIPILMGVAIDKRELLAGGATVRVEERVAIDPGATWEALKALVASAPRRAIEAGSSGHMLGRNELARVIDVDTVPATGAGGVAMAAEGAGGGSKVLTAGAEGNGLDGGNLTSKGGSS